MKVALVGATGRGGSAILKELVRRGHQITAVARRTDGVPDLEGVTAREGDVLDGEAMRRTLAGHDAAIIAVPFLPLDADTVLDAVRASGVPRFLVMGGAATLFVAPGEKLIDSPHFPPEYKPEASAAMRFLDKLKADAELDWTFLSPAAVIQHGERTGKFRIGGDDLLTDSEGNSVISFEDYAVAMVDELEQHQHARRRFSVAY